MVPPTSPRGKSLSTKTPSLAEVRARIDAVDTEILRLIDQRMQITRDVAAAKRADDGPPKFPLRPARESQIMRRLIATERDAATTSLVVQLWRGLMGESLYQQSPFHT